MAGKPQYQQGAMAVSSTVENHKGAETVTVDAVHNDTGDAAVRSISKLRAQESLPKKKSSTFQITSVKKQMPGEPGVEDIDSLDDLDETHTEDVSSNLLDVSQSTDVEPDPLSLEAGQSTTAVNAEELSKQEVVNHISNHTQALHSFQAGGFGSNSVIVNTDTSGTIAITNAVSKDKDGQSRFKVVKIESKEPFRRGRWTCLDYLDPHPEKSGQNEKSEVVPKQGEEVGSGNSSAASSVHYIPGVDDPSKNPFGQSGSNSNEGSIPVAELGQTHGQTSTMQNGQPTAQGQENGTSHVAPQKVTANGHSSVKSQSSINAQPQASLQGQGVTTPANVTMQQSAVPADRNPDFIQGQDPYLSQQGQDYVSHGNDYDYRTSAQKVDVNPSQPPSEYSQTQQTTDYTQAPHSLSSQPPVPQQGAAASNQPAGLANSGTSPNKDTIQTLDPGSKEGTFSTQQGTDQAIGQSEPVSIDAKGLKSFAGTLFKPFSSQAFPPPLLEMVSAHMQQQPQFGIIPRQNEDGGASTVAIDNKIEQAMDLVKSHLMFAVREEVDVLKEQIKELLEKNSQLEYENSILRATATPETLAKLSDVSKPQPPTTTS